MAQHKLYKALSILSKRELRDFRLFLYSPYCNQSAIAVTLFEYIRSAHPDFNHKKLDNTLIFKKLKPHKPFSQKLVIDRMSDLHKLLQKFLAYNYIKKNPEEQQKLVAKNLLVHNQYSTYLAKTKKELEILQKKPRPTWQYHLDVWLLNHTIFSHPQTQRFSSKNNFALNANAHLDETYAILKLRYGLHQLFKSQIFEEEQTVLPLLAEVIQHFKSSDNPIIQLYILLLNCYQDESQTASWQIAYDLLFKHLTLLPFEEKVIFITTLINWGNKIARGKIPTFFEKIFSLYQEGLTHKVWTATGKIEGLIFRNIATVGASTKKFDWTATFIQNYQSYLPLKKRNNIVNHANAYLFFYKGDCETALVYLDKLPQKSIDEKLTHKSLKCRCLYEQRCKDPSLRTVLTSFLDTFYSFINKGKLKEDTKEAYKNLIYFIRLLDKEKSLLKVGKRRKAALELKLERRPRFIAYSWIKEKIAEL